MAQHVRRRGGAPRTPGMVPRDCVGRPRTEVTSGSTARCSRPTRLTRDHSTRHQTEDTLNCPLKKTRIHCTRTSRVHGPGHIKRDVPHTPDAVGASRKHVQTPHSHSAVYTWPSTAMYQHTHRHPLLANMNPHSAHGACRFRTRRNHTQLTDTTPGTHAATSYLLCPGPAWF